MNSPVSPPTTSEPDLLVALLLSACLGALVGLPRQWSDQQRAHHEIDFGGVRTFTLWAVLGCLGAAAAERLGPLVLGVIAALVAAHQIVAISTLEARRAGGTTFAAVMVTLLLGALVFWGRRETALVAAAITAITVGIKRPVHEWTHAFTDDDIRATLQFLAITGVILPLAPNRAFGPFQAFNPYQTWLMVVLISGLGFAGYLAIRLLGARAGILLTSLLGGIASSTAATLAFARRAREEPRLSEHCAFGVVVASTVMLGRVAVAVGIVNRQLALTLIKPFCMLAIPALAYALWVLFSRRLEQHEVRIPKLSNPLSIAAAIKFGALYAVVSFLVKAAVQFHWQSSVLPLAFVSGLTDMDAISLSLARDQGAAGPMQTATRAIILAASSNTIAKAAIAMGFGSPALRRRTGLVLGATAVVGVAEMFLV